MTLALVILGAVVVGILYGWYLWWLFDYKLRPEVRERDWRRREREEREAYERRMSNPRYAARFKDERR